MNVQEQFPEKREDFAMFIFCRAHEKVFHGHRDWNFIQMFYREIVIVEFQFIPLVECLMNLVDGCNHSLAICDQQF